MQCSDESAHLEPSAFMAYTVLNQIYEEVYDLRGRLRLEWWPYGGHLAAHLRWGSVPNFGDLTTTAMTFITENDLDTIIRVNERSSGLSQSRELSICFMPPNLSRV